MEFLESNPIVDVDFVVSDYCRKQYLSSSHDEEFCEAEAVAKKSEVASSRDSGEWAEFHSMCIQSFLRADRRCTIMTMIFQKQYEKKEVV